MFNLSCQFCNAPQRFKKNKQMAPINNATLKNSNAVKEPERNPKNPHQMKHHCSNGCHAEYAPKQNCRPTKVSHFGCVPITGNVDLTC